MLRLRELQIPTQRATGKNGLRDLGAVGPDSSLRTHQTAKESAASKRASAGTSQGNLRKERGFGHADLRVRGDQLLLDLANVGPTFEQRRRHARRHFRRNGLLGQREPPSHTLWVVAE